MAKSPLTIYSGSNIHRKIERKKKEEEEEAKINISSSILYGLTSGAFHQTIRLHPTIIINFNSILHSLTDCTTNFVSGAASRLDPFIWFSMPQVAVETLASVSGADGSSNNQKSHPSTSQTSYLHRQAILRSVGCSSSEAVSDQNVIRIFDRTKR
ncbi:unnamed protein product [Rhodiola kirilowii]